MIPNKLFAGGWSDSRAGVNKKQRINIECSHIFYVGYSKLAHKVPLEFDTEQRCHKNRHTKHTHTHKYTYEVSMCCKSLEIGCLFLVSCSHYDKDKEYFNRGLSKINHNYTLLTL